MLTMQGGFDTTGSAISSALIYLERNPDAGQRLRERTGPDGTAVEEFLPLRVAHSSRWPGPPSATSRSAAVRSPRASASCWCGARAIATRRCSSAPTRWCSTATRTGTWRSASAPTAASGRRWPAARSRSRCARCCAACRTTRSTTRGWCARRRSASPMARSPCRSRSRPAPSAVLTSGVIPSRSPSRSPTPTSTSGTTPCAGLRWLFLEPGFEHPRLKGMLRLDAPRYTGAELRVEAGSAAPTKVVHVQCAQGDDATAETRWLDRLAGEQGLARRPGRRRTHRRPRRGRVIAANAAFPLVRGLRDLSVQTIPAPGEVAAAFDAAAPTGCRWS